MRSLIRLTDGWRFHAGAEDFPTPKQKNAHYCGAKTESRLRGFASLSYVERGESCHEFWQSVRVPHDYIMEQTPSPEYAGTLGSQKYGEGWYRRNFRFTEDDRGRRILLCFEAVATRCEIYFNGCPICENHTAYTPFEADITDFVRYGEKETNLLAVRVLTTAEHEGWWYTGAGIVRDVWLLKTDPTAVDMRGVWVRPVKESDTRWRCEIETTVVHDAPEAETVTVTNTIDGRTVSAEAALDPYGKTVVRQCITLESPRIWDTADPQMYTCRTAILRGGEEIDALSTGFGCRTAEFRPDGFYLNGKKTPIRGVCNHEDYGITGRAVPRSIIDYRVRLMREMGANGWRCAHYPHSDATMDALDRAGMLTMAETRHFSSAPEAMEQLRTLIRRDRNHPSVILWSIGNEEFFFADERCVPVARRMIAAVRQLDPDRAITAAVDKNVAASPMHDLVDVMGVNYNTPAVDPLHGRLPDKPMIYSECTASGTTRGWYSEPDDGAGMMGGYDNQTNGFGRSAAFTWEFVAQRPFMSGGYQWSGLEYRGEAEWPRLCSQSGAVDLFLQKKDRFWRMRTLWLDEPEAHILPHWNWRSREGEPITVHVFTNCAQVELLLNGTSVGRSQCGRFAAAKFAVPYQPGTLIAVGYAADGTELCRDTVATTGEPVGLRLRLDNAPEVEKCGAGSVAHVTAYAVDAAGSAVPDAVDTLIFSLAGEPDADYTPRIRRPRILGTGSSVCDPVPPSCRTRKMYAGLCAAAVEIGRDCPTRVVVHGERLGYASLDITAEK